ncbi:MAG TPA: DUF1295 domain-containing protein [Flavilitoribacter sp.]|nr:DUF1295 domain-containing protein [Flavilitoribacter sp.]HMQ90108.1 DUF1295 domain-containing protein [Flavilitoribacter sp.]
MISILLETSVLVFCYATLWFAVSILLRRNDIADIAWGLGYLAISLFLVVTRPASGIALLILVLIAIWAIRLSGHIYLRNRKKAEDFRYRKWREEWGRNWIRRSYLQVFLLQGFFMLVISAPIQVASHDHLAQPGFFASLGTAVWIIGFFFQAVGDYQLARFIKTRKNREAVLRTGLWRYSRHPNYFGEILMWWGLFLIVLPLPYGWVAAVSPLAITWLLAFVSGVPMLEKRYENNPAYQAYKKRTNALFPWKPGN